MQKNIYTTLMIMAKINKIVITIISLILVASCSIAPGMHMNTTSSFSSKEDFVYIESIDKNIVINSISNSKSLNPSNIYRIGNGDQIAITVWGLQDVFPITNINPDQNLRRVDSNGNIYFPYVGLIKAAGYTQNELRDNLTFELSKYFNAPQLDLTIARFNSQKVFILGEVTKPKKINLADVPLSLSDALGESSGLNTNTASGSEVFIIRQGKDNAEPMIFRADLASPKGFIDASNFYLQNNDIVYVNAKNTTRWNRVISQFFPFSTFLNSIDQLTNE